MRISQYSSSCRLASTFELSDEQPKNIRTRARSVPRHGEFSHEGDGDVVMFMMANLSSTGEFDHGHDHDGIVVMIMVANLSSTFPDLELSSIKIMI